MRIINVIEIIDGVINSVESFCVYEEQLVNDVVDTAEKYFIDKVKEHKNEVTEEDEEYYLEEGYFSDKSGYEITIHWSYICRL